MKLVWSEVLGLNQKNIEQVQNRGGAYRFSVRLEDKSLRIFYVGKAEDLKKRLLEYISGEDVDKCVQNHIKNHNVFFKYAYVDLEEDRKNIEYTLYKKYSPECNDVEPEGREIEINFN